jgi:hypothetical protein
MMVEIKAYIYSFVFLQLAMLDDTGGYTYMAIYGDICGF